MTDDVSRRRFLGAAGALAALPIGRDRSGERPGSTTSTPPAGPGRDYPPEMRAAMQATMDALDGDGLITTADDVAREAGVDRKAVTVALEELRWRGLIDVEAVYWRTDRRSGFDR